MTSEQIRPDDDRLAYAPLERAVFTREQVVQYLGLFNTDSLQRLVEKGELVPLTYRRPYLFARVECDRFIAEQLDAERKRRRIPSW